MGGGRNGTPDPAARVIGQQAAVANPSIAGAGTNIHDHAQRIDTVGAY
jgi:hypothetical protein